MSTLTGGRTAPRTPMSIAFRIVVTLVVPGLRALTKAFRALH